MAEVLASLDSVAHCIILGPGASQQAADTLASSSNLGSVQLLEAMVQPADGEGELSIGFERVPFASPLYIMFSSGTTGVPKAMIHSVGGTLLQHIKEHRLHTDVRPDDRLFYFTTCGWVNSDTFSICCCPSR